MIQFDLDKALARENIVNGLLLAVANIDDIVAIIRASESPKEAAEALIARYKFNKPQVEAILAMKLSALTRIDGVKLNEELEELVKFITECRYILNEPAALDEKLIEALNNVSQKFGDARRTRVENILGDEEEPEEIKEEDVIVLNNGSTIKAIKKDVTRGKRGKAQTEILSTNLGTLLLFTDSGKMYTESISKIKYDKDIKLTDVFPIGTEKPLLLIDGRTFNAFRSITCVTKNGFIKKSHTSEYLTRAKKGVGVIKLDEDALVSIILSSDDDDKVVIVSNADYYNCYSLSEIGYTGRMTKGVKAIKLDKDGYVKQAFSTSDDKYKITGRAVKGVKNG
jgi:DNA gyrase subunit A